MEIRPDPIQQSLRRLSNRLLELSAWRDRDSLLIPEGQFRVGPDAQWQPIRQGDPWPIQEAPVEFRFTIVIPERWAGLPVHCRLRLGGEALLFLDGHPVAGLNTFHDEYPILDRAGGGETVRLGAEVVSHGLFGTPTAQPRIDLTAIFVPENDIRSLCDDMIAALDAVRYLHLSGRGTVAESVLEAVHRAFTQILLPRGNTEEYLARFSAVSQDRSPGSFYGNEESLASLWERWEFPSPANPLTSEQLQRARDVKAQLSSELAGIRARFPTEGGVWLTGHAHIDLAWLWPLEETRRKARRTFYNVVGLMDRYPEFHFNQSSAQLYSWVEQDDPGLFEKIRAYVQADRWELVGGTWVEPDGNLPAGESWVRQLLFGQRYFQSRFGRRAKVAWLPDSFGFNGSLPQLLLSAGIPFFFTHKLTWNERNRFPYDLYWWEGLDGSRVLAHSFTNPSTGYNARLTAQEVGETWQNFDSKQLHAFSLLTFGYGDGGGGPSEEMLERYSRLREFPGLPALKLGRVTEFYEGISTASLPKWVGEQYLEYHRATFTTQGRVKSLHRRLEHALVEAEVAATLASVWNRSGYPQKELNALWQTLLLNEFHDILPGSSIHSVYEDAHRQLDSALKDVDRVRDSALVSGEPTTASGTALLVSPATGTVPQEYRVWNLQLRDRPLFVELTGVEGEPSFSINGRTLPAQCVADDRLLVSAEDTMVPSLGAVVIETSFGSSTVGTSAGASVVPNDTQIENQDLLVKLNTDGTLASIWDKAHGREVLEGRGNQLWLYTDIPRQFDAWDIDLSYTDEGAELLAEARPEVVERGPLRAALRVVRRHDNIEIIQDYRLRANSRLIEIYARVRWQGRRRILRALFPFAVRTHEFWAETAFGAVARPTHRNTPWDQARFEVPAHRWVDLSEPNYGVSLLNDGKYGHSAQGNLLGITLLRSPIYPDPYADEGEHEFTYAIYPHAGDWRQGTVQVAQDLHRPLIVTATSDTPLPSSLFRFNGDPLELACLKKAEDSDAVILRLYEANGNRGVATIETALRLQDAAMVNILEEESVSLAIEDERLIKISFTPFQVVTLKLIFAGARA